MQKMGLRLKAVELRQSGKTYPEINQLLGTNIPKSTLSYWMHDLPRKENYLEEARKNNLRQLEQAREKSIKARKKYRQEFFDSLTAINTPIAKFIKDKSTAKIALAMLCLGEAGKSTSNTGFYLASSDPRIIRLFIRLLKYCFNIDSQKFRFTVQCRADQNVEDLEKYWVEKTGSQKSQFYKAKIDPRTKGKPTKKPDYKGVLRVDYLNKKIQFELESLAQLVYNMSLDLGL